MCASAWKSCGLEPGRMSASAPGPPRLPPFRACAGAPTARPTSPQCMALLPAWLGLEDRKARAAGAVAELLDDPAITTTVMEDLALPAPQRLLGWGCSVVLPTAHAQALGLQATHRSRPAPWSRACTSAGWRASPA